MKYAIGIRTQNALRMPWIMTNFVLRNPLKKPMQQKKTGVRTQSIAYAFR